MSVSILHYVYLPEYWLPILVHAILRSSCRAVHICSWKRRLLHLQGLTLLQFSALFESSNTVYVLLMPLVKKRGWDSRSGALVQRRRFYVRSTSVSVHSRQDARRHKYGLLQCGDFCNAELMLQATFLLPSLCHFKLVTTVLMLDPLNTLIFIHGSHSLMLLGLSSSILHQQPFSLSPSQLMDVLGSDCGLKFVENYAL